MAIESLLDSMGAPVALLDWLRGRSDPSGHQACPRGAWAVWLAVASGTPLPQVLRAARETVTELVPGFDDAGELARLGPDLLRCSPAELAVHAETLECRAAGELDSYRRSADAPLGPLAVAAWLVRAAEGIATAVAIDSARRLEQAQQSAARLGVGMGIMWASGRQDPLAVDPARAADPGQDHLHYAAACLGEAMAALHRTLADPGVPLDPRDAHIAAVLRRHLGQS